MTLIYFVLILSILVFIHELGHFIFAKKSNMYVHEFAIGMGPKIFSFNRKNDETLYSLRLLPIGGFCRIAGEDEGMEEDQKVDKDRQMNSKTGFQRFCVLFAGAAFNFIFGILILFILGLINGSTNQLPYVNTLVEGYPAYESKLEEGDLILSVNNKKVSTWDELNARLLVEGSSEAMILKVKKSNGSIDTVSIVPKAEEIEGVTYYRIGITSSGEVEKGIIPALKFTYYKFTSLVKTMAIIIGNLFTGKIGLDAFSGPVGIYNVVGSQSVSSISGTLLNILYLMSVLSINLGFVNLIPFPAFDGGRILFLIIEKIRRKPINRNIEAGLNTVGFLLLMILMIVITYKDIVKLF